MQPAQGIVNYYNYLLKKYENEVSVSHFTFYLRDMMAHFTQGILLGCGTHVKPIHFSNLISLLEHKAVSMEIKDCVLCILFLFETMNPEYRNECFLYEVAIMMKAQMIAWVDGNGHYLRNLLQFVTSLNNPKLKSLLDSIQWRIHYLVNKKKIETKILNFSKHSSCPIIFKDTIHPLIMPNCQADTSMTSPTPAKSFQFIMEDYSQPTHTSKRKRARETNLIEEGEPSNQVPPKRSRDGPTPSVSRGQEPSVNGPTPDVGEDLFLDFFTLSDCYSPTEFIEPCPEMELDDLDLDHLLNF